MNLPCKHSRKAGYRPPERCYQRSIGTGQSVSPGSAATCRAEQELLCCWPEWLAGFRLLQFSGLTGCRPLTHEKMIPTPQTAESPALILAVLLLGAVGLAWYVASEHLHLTHAQIAELSLYTRCFSAVTCAVLLPLTSRQRRERQWPHSPLVMAPDRIRGRCSRL